MTTGKRVARPFFKAARRAPGWPSDLRSDLLRRIFSFQPISWFIHGLARILRPDVPSCDDHLPLRWDLILSIQEPCEVDPSVMRWTPNPISVTLRTRLRFGPSKLTTALNDLLDGNTQGKYHRNTLYRASGPVHSKGGRSLKPPPLLPSQNIPIISPVRSTYSENINMNQSIQSDFLQ